MRNSRSAMIGIIHHLLWPLEWSLSPYINRFLSADTIVPGYANPQNLNRYSYVTNNPLRYTDPTGHMVCEDYQGSCLSENQVTKAEKQKREKNKERSKKKDKDDNVGSGKLLYAPNPNDIIWCNLLDCALSAAGFGASAFTFAPPPWDLVATGVDVVATLWAIGRTEDDYSQGKISQTRRLLLHGTPVVGLAPA